MINPNNLERPKRKIVEKLQDILLHLANTDLTEAEKMKIMQHVDGVAHVISHSEMMEVRHAR